MFNIAQTLKNAPKGLRLYSPIFGDCEFDGVNEKDEIRIRSLYKVCCSNTERSYLYILNGAGQLHPTGEVMLYPNSIMKEWKGWQEILFKKGDVITNNIVWQMKKDTIEDLHHFGILFKIKATGKIKKTPDGIDSNGCNWYEINRLHKEEVTPFVSYGLEKLGYKLK